MTPTHSSRRVAGSLWSVERSRQRDETLRLAAAGLRLWHWDRADGTLGARGGFTAPEARALALLTSAGSEAHLMLKDPLAELDAWLGFCERVVVHVEADDWREAVARITASGVRAAVAASPDTDLSALDLPPGIAVLVMSVYPGEGGGTFRPDSASRISSLAERGFEVGVDGGVDAPRALESIIAGATWIVSGTALLKADPVDAWIRRLEW